MLAEAQRLLKEIAEKLRAKLARGDAAEHEALSSSSKLADGLSGALFPDPGARVSGSYARLELKAQGVSGSDISVASGVTINVVA